MCFTSRVVTIRGRRAYCYTLIPIKSGLTGALGNRGCLLLLLKQFCIQKVPISSESLCNISQ